MIFEDKRNNFTSIYHIERPDFHSVLIVRRFLIVSAAKYDTLGMLRMVERRMTGPTYSAALMVTPRAVVSSR